MVKSIYPRTAIAPVAAMMLASCGASTPFEDLDARERVSSRHVPEGVEPSEAARSLNTNSEVVTLDENAPGDAYVLYALANSPKVEAAVQRWRAAAARTDQVGVLPDPRFDMGFFLEEVETRTGPQRARFGLSQTFPWPGVLSGREDRASIEARAAWREVETARLEVTEDVVTALHELAYLDASVRITREMLSLLESFEESARARYRVGSGSHPALVRVQVELGRMEDRLAELSAMRSTYEAELNAALNRPSGAEVPSLGRLPGRIVEPDVAALTETARSMNPALLTLDERIEAARAGESVAKAEGMPDLTVGLDYIVTGEAVTTGLPDSGNDPVLLRFGITLPISREKYDALEREATSNRLAISGERTQLANTIASRVRRAHFEHTDAHRRVVLYETTLIPKAEESLESTLGAFRAGEASFLDLLDTERTLLEFSLALERARADRGAAMARLERLVGTDVQTRRADETNHTEATP